MYYKLALSFLILALVDDVAIAEPTWTTLRATWSVNIASSKAFAKLPRQERKAIDDGWVKIPGPCAGKFLGTRYMRGTNPDIVLIYDVNGYIAGVQNGIPESELNQVEGTSGFSYTHSSTYVVDDIQGAKVYFTTAYLVEPSSICFNGRTESQYKEGGTGTGVWFQNGTDPTKDLMHVPMYEPVENTTPWVRGKCFMSIGVHYWYGMSEDMSCDNFFPFTTVYNRGKLTGFAFVNFGKFEFSRRFEHPPKFTLSAFLPSPIPQCVLDEYEKTGGYSSIHIFFSVRPWNLKC